MIVAMAATALIMAAQADVAEDPAASLDALKQLYAQSCGSRAYAAYDDVCDQISHQMRQAEIELGRQARHVKHATAAPPAKPAEAPQPVTPAAAASNGTTPKAR